ADPHLRYSRRRAGHRRADGPDDAGQEGEARPADVHSGARHRLGLRCARRRRSASARPPCGQASMSPGDRVAGFSVPRFLPISFLFAGSETALIASSRAAMLRLARDGNPKAAIVNRLLEMREQLIGALLVGQNVANIAASALATDLMLKWFGDAGVLAATAV